jgi:hypothetical protein
MVPDNLNLSKNGYCCVDLFVRKFALRVHNGAVPMTVMDTELNSNFADFVDF